MDCGWDTSDDECGMQINLDSPAEEVQEFNLDKNGVLEKCNHHIPDASTDDCDQSEPTKYHSSSELSRTEKSAIRNNAYAIAHIDDAADVTPTSDNADKGEVKVNGRNRGGICHFQTEVAKSECSFDGENDGHWNSEMSQTQNGCSSSHGGDNTSSELTSCVSPNDNLEQVDEDVQNSDVADILINWNCITKANNCKMKSPSLDSLNTDENTQKSISEDTDVTDGALIGGDFDLEKENFEKILEQENSHSSCSNKDLEVGKLSQSLEDSSTKSKRQVQDKEMEMFRKQEEVHAGNEQLVVNLCRDESSTERIEEDVSKRKKKTRKKDADKKIRKKGKKLKKRRSKKIKSKQKNEDLMKDHRFVEIRGDRLSVESKEEGEIIREEGSCTHRKSPIEGVSEDVYEPVLDENAGDEMEDEQREPGEIVDEKKKRKKKDKKIRKKKKHRRRVATIEEGSQGDGDFQKFPTFLDGFFVQNEEGEDDSLDNVVQSLDNNVRTFEMGNKPYWRHRSSDSEDNMQSLHHSIRHNESADNRFSEFEHRRRRLDESEHGVMRRRQHEIVRLHEGRHELEHHFGSPRVRNREHGWDRERSRSERDRHNRERVRDNEREIRGRGREHERNIEAMRARNRDRRRTEMVERRRQQDRSSSQDQRQRSSTVERISQTTLRGSSSWHRHGSRTRERSPDRERERSRERSKHRRQNRSPEREPARRVILSSHFHSTNSQNKNGKTGSDKENREERQRTERVSMLKEMETSHRRIQRKRKDQERRKSTSSSSTASSDCFITHRNRNILNRHQNSDDDNSSSDVILVESERVVINLVDEEDQPSRVNMTTQTTQTATEDDNLRLLDAAVESTSLLRNQVSNTPIDNNKDISKVAGVNNTPKVQKDFVAAPTIDEPTKEVRQHQPNSLIKESDYDPAHPTEEVEELEMRPTTPKFETNPIPPADVRSFPVPDHPLSAEARPSLPPIPSLMDTAIVISQPQPPFANPTAQLNLPLPFQEQLRPPQQLPPLQPFLGLGQIKRFPPPPVVNGPSFNSNIPLNNSQHQTFSPAKLDLRPIPETHPMFPIQQSNLPFRSPVLHRPLQSVPSREILPHQMNMQHQMPISVTSNVQQSLPSKMSVHRFDHGITQAPQMFRPPLSMSLLDKNSLVSSLTSNMSTYHPQPSRENGCDLIESTELVDMDMSPRDDNYGLEFVSPSSSCSDIDNRWNMELKSDSQVGSSSDKFKPTSSTGKGITAVHNEAFSKDVNRLTNKGQMQPSSTTQKSKFQSSRKRRVEVSDDDDDEYVDEDDVPTSAVDLTNKEKYMKKLHFQERVIDEVKMAIKPFYNSKKITKEQYKIILRKAVPKVCHSKSGNINPQRILHLVEAYVRKIVRGRASGGSSKKRKQHPYGLKDTANPASLRQNGGRGKNVTR